MEIKVHQTGDIRIGEVLSDRLIINSVEDGVDLMGNVYYQGLDRVILHKKNITPAFFDLKTKMAGEVLQKFSTYQVKLVIVGDFSEQIQHSNSLKDFIYESNKGKQTNFLGSVNEAVKSLTE